jgi:hypothetical protein
VLPTPGPKHLPFSEPTSFCVEPRSCVIAWQEQQWRRPCLTVTGGGQWWQEGLILKRAHDLLPNMSPRRPRNTAMLLLMQRTQLEGRTQRSAVMLLVV